MPAQRFTPEHAEKALQIMGRVQGIGQLRVFFFLLAHNQAWTCDELAPLLKVSRAQTWMHLTALVNAGFVAVIGTEHTHSPRGAKCHLYQLKEEIA
jgi:predicted transcriptional regulator